MVSRAAEAIIEKARLLRSLIIEAMVLQIGVPFL